MSEDINKNNNTITETEHKVKDASGNWYVICCQVGKELEAKAKLEEKIKSSPDIQKKIFEVLVPEEEEIVIKKGQKTTVRKALYKGYIYINMIFEPDTYNFVRSVTWIKGFLGGAKTQPLSEREINNIKMLVKKLEQSGPKVIRKFEVGDTVRIIDGAGKDLTGIVKEVNEEKSKLKVSLTFFGRPTVVELDFIQVEKV